MHHRGVPPYFSCMHRSHLLQKWKKWGGKQKDSATPLKHSFQHPSAIQKARFWCFSFLFCFSSLSNRVLCAHPEVKSLTFRCPYQHHRKFFFIFFFSVPCVQILNHEYPQPHAYGGKEKRVQTHRQSTKDLMNLSPNPCQMDFPPIFYT